MAAPPVLNNVSAVRFQQARVMNVANLTLIVTPQFTPDQIAPLQQNPEGAIRSVDQNLWLTLTGWLDAPLSAVVQCRRSGLTVQLNRRSGISGTLLPAGAGSPSASLRYRLPNGAQQQRPLQTLLDATNGYLRLTLLFENSNVYDEVLTAMTTPAGEAFIDIAFVHLYQLKAASQTPEVDPRVVLRPRRRRAEPIMRTMPATMARTPVSEMTVARSGDPNLEAANVRMANVDMRRVTLVAQPTQGDTSVLQDQSYSGKLTVPLTHARTETGVFPDLPRQSQNGWGQVPRNPKLHFRDSGRVDTFYYLPTSFKLGYYFEKQGGAAGARPPLRVELYRDADGNERIKATIVALPCIEDTERAALRTFLRDNLLQGVQPFIFLEPRSGLQGKFVDDFTAGSASDQRTLPAEISLQVVEVASEDRMVLRFDMPALKYPIFCELLKAGIFGRVLLTENGLEAQVEVRLQLEDIVTNLVQIEQGGPAGQPADSSAPSEAPPAPPPDSSSSARRRRRGRRSTFQDMLEVAATVSSRTSETSSDSREGGRLTLQDILEIAARASAERGEAPSSDTPSSDSPSSGTGSSGSSPSSTTPPPPAGGTSLTIRNLLDCDLKISSLTLSLLDLGELSGMVFEAEDLRLLPSGAELPAQANAGSALNFSVTPKRLIAWDETVVEAGQIKVMAGSADDWLNRVNRDPSLQQHEFKVQLQLIVPAGIRDRVQLIRLRLLKDGDPTIRSRMDLLPESSSPVLHVPMTLEELMGTAGKTPSFSIEYETLAADGNLSLTQRVGIAPGMGAVILRAIVQTPSTLFTVEYQTQTGTVREELDRQAAEQLIAKLSRNAQHWEIFTKEPEPTRPEQRPDTPPPDIRDTTSPSVEVTIVTDLAKVAFSNGTLTRIFVVLKPDQEAGPQSSFVFDSSNQRRQHGARRDSRFRLSVTRLPTYTQAISFARLMEPAPI